MKTKMMTVVKKVTAAVIAAVTVMTMTVATMPAVAHAEEQPFDGIRLDELPEHPTAGMDVNVIKNAYKVGNQLRYAPSGTIVYIENYACGPFDAITPQGSDIVVVYRVYHKDDFFGQSNRISCKSLINGESFDLSLDTGAFIFEINKASSYSDAGISVDKHGLQTYWDSAYSSIIDWFK